ncbi:MAG: GatB/YqeY domain-containing protein [Gemmatimonadales bacterium]|nr:GatB/YqeY domain-containing protein [Gemmatimonadales bacterium]
MSDTLVEQIRAALNAARKDRDNARTLLYSTLLSDLKNRDIELGREVSEAESVEVVRRSIKRRRESVEQYGAAGRKDLADQEAFELAELEKYLPPAVPEDEIRDAVKAAIAAGAKDLGALMGKVMPQFKGRAEGRVINQIAREELAG